MMEILLLRINTGQTTHYREVMTIILKARIPLSQLANTSILKITVQFINALNCLHKCKHSQT